VFEPGFCRQLISLFESQGIGEDSGFMREEDGKTVSVVDYLSGLQPSCGIGRPAADTPGAMAFFLRSVPAMR
jgi:hypothetical protein